MGTNVNALVNELENIKKLLESKNTLETKLGEVDDRKKVKISAVVDSTHANQRDIYNKKRASAKYKNTPSLNIIDNGNAPVYIKADDLKAAKESMARHYTKSRFKKLSFREIAKKCELQQRLILGLIAALAIFLFSNILLLINGTFIFIVGAFIRIVTFLGAGACGVMLFLKRDDFKEATDVMKRIENDKSVKLLLEWKNNEKKTQTEIEKYVNELNTDNYEEMIESFFENFKEYDKEYTAIAEDYYKAIAPLADECEKAVQKVEVDFADYQKKVESALSQANEIIDSITILHPSMFDRIDKISQVLTLGRADSIKEAINIVLDDERREAEEAERRREAERRLAAEEQHRRQMEYEAERAAKAAEEKEKEAKKQADKDLFNRQLAAIDRCGKCIHRSSCGYNLRESFKKSGDICPSYRPSSR